MSELFIYEFPHQFYLLRKDCISFEYGNLAKVINYPSFYKRLNKFQRICMKVIYTQSPPLPPPHCKGLDA